MGFESPLAVAGSTLRATGALGATSSRIRRGASASEGLPWVTTNGLSVALSGVGPDLPTPLGLARRSGELSGLAARVLALVVRHADEPELAAGRVARPRHQRRGRRQRHDPLVLGDRDQIGRASCRERV